MSGLCIYLLRLRNGKFYVGSSNDVDRRFQQHLDGVGSEWTRLHAPACRAPRILETNASLLDEDKFTKKLMIEHGVGNVRGGSYCQVELTDAQLAALEAELRSATAACLCCGACGTLCSQLPCATATAATAEAALLSGKDYGGARGRLGCRCDWRGDLSHTSAQAEAKSAARRL